MKVRSASGEIVATPSEALRKKIEEAGVGVHTRHKSLDR